MGYFSIDGRFIIISLKTSLKNYIVLETFLKCLWHGYSDRRTKYVTT